MHQFLRTLDAALKDENGATMIEYGLIAALLGIAIVGALSTLGTNLGKLFNNVAGNM
jgi:pilus assembly protein Flp/PilA